MTTAIKPITANEPPHREPADSLAVPAHLPVSSLSHLPSSAGPPLGSRTRST